MGGSARSPLLRTLQLLNLQEFPSIKWEVLQGPQRSGPCSFWGQMYFSLIPWLSNNFRLLLSKSPCTKEGQIAPLLCKVLSAGDLAPPPLTILIHAPMYGQFFRWLRQIPLPKCVFGVLWIASIWPDPIKHTYHQCGKSWFCANSLAHLLHYTRPLIIQYIYIYN